MIDWNKPVETLGGLEVNILTRESKVYRGYPVCGEIKRPLAWTVGYWSLEGKWGGNGTPRYGSKEQAGNHPRGRLDKRVFPWVYVFISLALQKKRLMKMLCRSVWHVFTLAQT